MGVNYQDALDLSALSVGLKRKAKGYFGVFGTVAVEVSLEPQPRFARMESILASCSLLDENGTPSRWFYTFNQGYASSGDWKSRYLDVPADRRVDRVVSDFSSTTVPFLRQATSVRSVAEMLIRGEIPPSNIGIAPRATIQDLFAMGRDFGMPDVVDLALDMARTTVLDEFNHEVLARWFAQMGVRVELPAPDRPRRRRWWRTGRD